MKCAECRFWREVSDQLFDGLGFGTCRRRSPSPTFENFMGAARALEHGPTESGAEPYGTRQWGSYVVNWPVTGVSDYCGDFVPGNASMRAAG